MAAHLKNKKKNFQIGNKIYLNLKSKNENRPWYFYTELIKPIAPNFFDDKEKITCILSATSILKMLLPERQINKNIYISFEKFLNDLNNDNWLLLYIYWEVYLIKELGYEIDISNEFLNINNKLFKIPSVIYDKTKVTMSKNEIKEALNFNKNLIIENFINPNKLRFPLFRNLFESYF